MTESTRPDPEFIPGWPVFRIRSEAHGKNTKVTRIPVDEDGNLVEKDALEINKLHRVEVKFDVQDAVRLTFHSYAGLTEVDTQGVPKHEVRIYETFSGYPPEYPDVDSHLVRGEGVTPSAAMFDAARKLQRLEQAIGALEKDKEDEDE